MSAPVFAHDRRFIQAMNLLHRGGAWRFITFESEQKKTITLMEGGTKEVPCERESIWFEQGQPVTLPPIEGQYGPRHFWFGVNPCSEIPSTNAKGKEVPPKWVRAQTKSVAAVNSLYAEYDAKDYSDSKDNIVQHVRQLSLQPSMLVDSGGGYHCYWFLNVPFALTDENRDDATVLQHAWVRAVGGDLGAKNIARVLRIPNTYNVKPKYKEEGYPRVKIVEVNFDRLYALQELRDVIPKEAFERVEQYTNAGEATLDKVTDASRLLDMLSSARFGYNDWLNVGMALSELGGIGLELWDTWSRRSDKYDRAEIEDKWPTFKGGVGPRITMSSLAQMAKEDSPGEFAKLSKPAHDPKGIGTLERIELTEKEFVDKESWRDKLEVYYTKKGDRRIYQHDYNLAIILQNDPDIAGAIGYDEFRSDVVCVKDPPWNATEFSQDLTKTELHTPWDDHDYHTLKMWLQKTWGLNFTENTIVKTVYSAAKKISFHPVCKYLDSLQWDGVERIDTWLIDYMGATQEEYAKLVGPKWLIAACARVFEPGCKVDNVLIFEGVQGLRKSTAIKTLASIEWFADTPFHINSKDAYLGLRGVWLVELAELDSIMKADDSEAKAFFTSGIDRYRPPYARSVRDFPRQCVFAGSVNEKEYLRDATGSRRYWPVECSKVELSALKQDRDQLWAEALQRYRKGDRWWLEGTEHKLAQVEQEQRATDDPWEDPIDIWIRDCRTGEEKVSVSEILKDAILLSTDKMNRSHQTRVGRIMTRKGWERKRERDDKGNMRTVYYRPEDR